MNPIRSIRDRAVRWFRSRPVTEVGYKRGGLVHFWRHDLFKCGRFAVYLHRFERSDWDRCLHDHPWPFLTIILRGGYWEEVPARRTLAGVPVGGESGDVPTVHRWRRPGAILYRPARFSHRIQLDPERPRPVSLVIVGRKCRPWGFWTLEGWRAWVDGFLPICETED